MSVANSLGYKQSGCRGLRFIYHYIWGLNNVFFRPRPYFTGELIKCLTKELNVDHHFTTRTSSWGNGTVEGVCSGWLNAVLALLYEIK